MKTKILIPTLMSLLVVSSFAQDRTTVNATSSEISDNLDLRAVASIFGDSKDLEDFEYRLNDPKNQISNLDLNGDNQVDYLRVVESVEGRTHIIVVQSVLGRDVFQDVATLEVERDNNNQVQVQVVGDVYMYGTNYIYEPVYVHTPIIYSYFWVPNYRPYCSTWYWGYYPTHFYAWNPFPIFRYRSHIGLFINFSHNYNYVSYRRCQVAYNNYYGRRGNGYERQYPNRSFASRNASYTNRHELDRTRNIRTVGESRNLIADNGTRGNSRNENGRSNTAVRDNSTRANTNSRDVNSRSNTTSRDNSSRDVRNDSPRANSNSRDARANETTTRGNSSREERTYEATPRNNTPREVRSNEGSSRSNSSRNVQSQPSRSNESRSMSAPREQRSQPSMNQRSASPRPTESRGNGGGNPSRGNGQSRSSDRR
ncbi:MAG: hypothetical protein V4648_02045 [Bacteroidota bacterium]